MHEETSREEQAKTNGSTCVYWLKLHTIIFVLASIARGL